MSKNSAAVAAIESPALPLESQLLTVEEAQARLKISLPHLYGLFNRGELKSVMQGNRRFVTMRQLAEYIDRLEEKGAPLPKDRPNNYFRPKKPERTAKRSGSKKQKYEARRAS